MLPIDNYEAFIEHFRQRVRNDWDVVMPITGLEGSGKSISAFQLALHLDNSFNVDKICWDVTTAIRYGLNSDKYSVIVLDEAFEGAFNRDFMKGDNKKWVKFMGTARKRNLIILICFPRYANLDEYIRGHRSTHWLHCQERGLNILYIPKRHQLSGNTYWQPICAVDMPAPTNIPWLEEYQKRKDAYIDKIND